MSPKLTSGPWRQWCDGFRRLGPQVLAKLDGPMGTLGIRQLKSLWESIEPRSGLKHRQVQGPVTAAAPALDRIGWNFQGHFVLQTHEGKLFSLVDISPKLLEHWLQDACTRTWEIKAAKSLRQIQNVPRVCLDVARRVLNASGKAKLSGGQAALQRAALCQAYWAT
eukprot:151753-Pyramimonas_sp.AAC.1